GFFFASGCNVAGLSISPALGDALAAWILDGAPPIDLAPLAATRFETASWSEEQLRERARWQYRHFYGAVWLSIASRLEPLEFDDFGEDDAWHRPVLVERGRGHRIVEIHHRNRPPAAALTAELHTGDVDPVAPAQGADAADDTRHVEVREHEHPALRHGFER